MSSLLAIDPATHGCGAAYFVDGKLVAAAYVQNRSKEVGLRKWTSAGRAVVEWLKRIDEDLYLHCEMLGNEFEFVCELPQVYQRGGGRTKGDPNMIVIPLVAVDSAVTTLLPFAKVVHYKPFDWKGNTKKPLNASGEFEYVITTRVKERLDASELACVEWSRSVEHSWDVGDAVAVGLFHLGRFGRIRAFARE